MYGAMKQDDFLYLLTTGYLDNESNDLFENNILSPYSCKEHKNMVKY